MLYPSGCCCAASQVLDILLGDEKYMAMGAHPVRVSEIDGSSVR